MEGRCRKSSCQCRHPPVCRKYTSGNTCIYGNNCVHRHADGEEKPSKTSKSERPQGAVSILEEKVQGCLKIQVQRSLFCGNLGKRVWTLRGDTPENSDDALGTKLNSGKKQGNLEALSKKVILMSEILARQSLRKRNTWGNFKTRRVRQQSNMAFGEKYASSRPRTKLRRFSCEKKKHRC